MKFLITRNSLMPKIVTAVTLFTLGFSLLVATPAIAASPDYSFDPTIESKTVQTQLCEVKSAVCNDTFGFGFIGKTLVQGKRDLPLLESQVDFKTNLTGWFQDFSEPLNVAEIKAANKAGRTPVITWEPQKIGDKTPDNYPLKAIAAGTFDKYLISSAKLAKSAGSQFVLRFAHEMNGYWYPWGMPKPGDPRSLAAATNTPAIYIAAFRHVHDIFDANGATNVQWMWSPNLIDATPAIALSSLYPGDKYVDVVGLSGYLHGSDFMYEARFRPTLNQLDEVALTKPIIIAEGGVDHALMRTMLTTDLIAGLAREPRVQGFLWLNKVADVYDYSVADDPDVVEAIKNGLDQPAVTITPSYTAAVSLRASIAGEAVVGATLSAQGNYRGTALSTRYTWLSCPSATSDVADCSTAGVGAYHVVTDDDRHRYLQVALAVKSLAGYDYSRSAVVGPVLTPQFAATLPAAYTRGTSTQLVFGAAPVGATHVVIKLDSNTPVYMPATTTEYWFNSLALGSAHTFSVAYADLYGAGKLLGEAATGSFTAAGAITAPALSVFGDVLTVGLASPAVGQTAWRYQIDSDEIKTIASSVTSFTAGNLSVGAHTLSLWAISGNATTLVKSYGFNVLVTPVAPAISLQPGAIWLTFADQPAGLTSIQIYVDNKSPVTISAYGLKTYKISELANGVSHKVSLRYAILNNSQQSIGGASLSTFTLIPVPTTATGKLQNDGIMFTLPDVSAGQTGWFYSLDGADKTAVPNEQKTVFIAEPSVALHTFSLWAVSNDGVTLPQNISFDYGSTPERPTLNLRSTAVQFVFAEIPKGVTNLLLSIDGEDEIGISPTLYDYWINNLATGSTHTYKLRYERMVFGAPSYGASLSGSFTVLKSPDAPTINSTPAGLSISFPQAFAGQQYWKYSLDGSAWVTVATATTSISLPAVSVGLHSFKLQAGAEEGFSVERETSFTVLAAPLFPTLNLRSTSTQFILPTTPKGVTAILVQVDDLPVVRLSATAVDYWANNLNLGQSYRLKISYEYVSGTTTTLTSDLEVPFIPLKAPNQASIDATGLKMIVSLPATQIGQTGWAYSLDGAAVGYATLDTISLLFDLPGLGAHSFDLYAVADGALTLAKNTSFFKYASPTSPAVNLRGTGTQLSFSAAPSGVSKVLIQIDDLTPIQFGPTEVEYWFNGAELGSRHTFSISYLYTNSFATVTGDKTNGAFIVLKSSDAATVKVTSTEYTVTLPASASGQTGWSYSLDSGSSVAIGVDVLKVNLSVPSVGAHTFNLQSVGELGKTLTKTTSFTYIAAPTTVQAVLSGTGTKMTFGAAPAGMTNLVVQVDDLAAVYLPTSTTEYWVNNLEKGSSHSFKAWYKSTATGITVEGAVKTLLFVPLSTPATASVSVSANSALVSFPTPATGQTGWQYSLETELNYIAVDASTSSVIIGSLAAGTHKVYLKAVGKDGLTISVVKSFTVS